MKKTMQFLSSKHYLALLFTATLSFGFTNSFAKPEGIITGDAGSKLSVESFGTFNQPWAMTFLPNGKLLITEKPGKLVLVNLADSSKVNVAGLPKVAFSGQGGMGDVVLHPQFEKNNWVYLSYAEQDAKGDKGAVVIRGKLRLDSASPSLENVETIWSQLPKVSGNGHYSHRIAFSPDGYLFITSGDRQKLEPAQLWDQNLGKVIRLNDDGSVPNDNPFQNKGELAKTFWSIGHRNMLGIAFDAEGRLWTNEMGPRHGDELNLTVRGDNFGWPLVSWGNHYSGWPIPDHDTRPDFNAPEAYWVPTIAPSGLIIYDGNVFPKWRDNVFIGGLKSMALLRIKVDGSQASEAERFDMGKRIREVEQGPKGAIWVLEDNRDARLLKLSPP